MHLFNAVLPWPGEGEPAELLTVHRHLSRMLLRYAMRGAPPVAKPGRG